MNKLEENFIKANINLDKDDSEINKLISLDKISLQKRWETPYGQNIISKWKESNFDRAVLDELVGKYYNQTDLRGISLLGLDLKSKNLSNIDFFAANLERADFSKANLANTWLSESNIKAAKFDWAILDNCLLDNVQFDRQTSFVGVNLSTINFTLAALLQDLAINQQRIKNLEETQPRLATVLRLSCDYGRSFSKFFTWVAVVVVLFAVLYSIIPNTLSQPNNFLNSLYFSFVTFTTLGFGDISPISSIAKFLVILEVFIGYLMLGLLVAIISKKVIPN